MFLGRNVTVTNNVTDQWIIQLLTVLQQQHCISDVVTANDCVTLKHATVRPAITTGIGRRGQPQ